MVQRITTLLLLTAITVQAVFGGLQDSVYICLGGGHEHKVEEVVESCAMECNHHNDWATPVSNTDDIDNCECTDLELALISLLTIPRDKDVAPVVAVSSLSPTTITIPIVEYQSTFIDKPPIEKQRLSVIRTTRLLI